jgi:branched-subunit amino acid transport protein
VTYFADHGWWWPYLFIIIAGWVATDLWRWLGVLAGNRLRDDSPALDWVRAVATALVAAVIAKLILYPSGGLAEAPVLLRVGAAALGFLAFLYFRQTVWIGIVVAISVLAAGLFIWPLPPA